MNQNTPQMSRAGLEELEQKYLEERDKRTVVQTGYTTIKDESEWAADPFAPDPSPREPVRKDLDHLVIGAGIAGVTMAANLQGAGFDDYLVVEKGADYGGTWYWNRYPGIHCDTESYIYFPMLETVDYVPSQKYTPGHEIRGYIRKLAEHFGLEAKTLFQTRVIDVHWNDEAARWIVQTDRGDEIRSRHLMLASGGLLHRPHLPAIPGVETFKGRSFHASRWDYEYTGGNPTGNLTKLVDKRVAIIGTGATAVQAVPKLAESAGKLYVFQRTPSVVDERNQQHTDHETWQTVARHPEWQAERRHNFEAQIFAIPTDENMVNDNWARIFRNPPPEVGPDGSVDMEEYSKIVQAIDVEEMERVRRRVEETVEDPKTAEALKPYFHRFCKRPTFNDEFYPAFNRPNVELVDTEGRGVERISEHALHFGNRDFEVDVIIYATGFDSMTTPTRAGGFDVVGRSGVSLDDYWANGVRTMHGTCVHNFPNMYIIGNGRHSSAGPNYTQLAETHIEHVVGILEKLKERGADVFEVREKGEEYWASVVAQRSQYDEEFQKSCTPNYWNNDGKLREGLRPQAADVYAGSTRHYGDELREWRETADLEEYCTIRTAESASENSVSISV
ncbi:flavin-containing monooxygenase [Nocardia sp. CA-290969]|uniref:flavin-containing monooxygenase n=1 Tax=Nocardia sp. CA-290969 TaxID=3239986 RepID=UPI003D918AC4